MQAPQAPAAQCDAAFWIRRLSLSPHPEGGFFRETYRSAESVDGAHLPARFGSARAFSTAIYFLLPGDQISALHRIKSDEIWHFYAGTTLALRQITPDGALVERRLGPCVEAGDELQVVVPAGAWFGARVLDRASYALLGCTVAPGFDFADFELGDRAALRARWPQHTALIEALTRPSAMPTARP